MIIALGSDHHGVLVRKKLGEIIRGCGHGVQDFGPESPEGLPIDYPDVATQVAGMVSCGEADRGVLICGTGIGMCITANKFSGVRAAPVIDELTAVASRQHNDLNVLCLSGDMLSEAMIDRLAKLWIETPFEGGRHVRRIEKIHEVERERTQKIKNGEQEFSTAVQQSKHHLQKFHTHIMKMAVFFIGRKRPGFEPAWGTHIEREIRDQLQRSPFEPLFFGPITDEAAMQEAIIGCYKAEVETIIISQPTMGDGNLWPILLAEWCGGIVVWATPENPKNPKVSACGLVGAHNWVSGMAQADAPPYLVYGMPGVESTIADLNDAIYGSAATAKLRCARVGLIGDHAPGFMNMAVDAAAMLRLLGTRLRRFGLHEFFSLVRSYSDDVVAADRAKAESLRLPIRDGVALSDDVWNISSRFYLAVRELAETESLDAVALRCWPEIPNEFGVWPYLAIPRLASDGINICEEGDVDGALGCLLAKALGCETAAFNSDWLEHDDDSILLWHGGATPWKMCQPIGLPGGPTLNVHYNSGKPVMIDAELLYGMDVTLFRFWRMGERYSLAIAEGCVEKPPRTVEGCAGTVRIPGGGVKRFFLDVCNLGMPHHVVVMKGHYGAQLRQFAERFRPGPMEVVREIGIRSSRIGET